jgi:tetratricopeptide (TPR) repeat protein
MQKRCHDKSRRITRRHTLAAELALVAVVVLGGFCVVAAQNVASIPSPAISQQFHRALELAQHGDPQQAMVIVQQVLDADPRYAPALKLKGMLLQDGGHSAEAGAAFEEGLKYAPNDADLLFETGVYKLATGDKADALKLLERCTKLQPRDGDTFFYLAQAYHLNGNDDEAIHAIERSSQLEPDNAAVWQKYGELQCSGSDCAHGLKFLEKAQRLDATLPRLDYDIGSADYKLMDLAGAEQSLSHAVAAHPDDLTALDLLASTEIRLSNWQAAKDDYTQLSSYKPNDPDLLLSLGHCELELKEYPTAVSTLQQLLHVAPERFVAHFYLSRAYAAMGNAEAAQHEAALHQLMMSQATFIGHGGVEAREHNIAAQAQQLLKAHHKDQARQLYLNYFKGTTVSVADSWVFAGKLELYSGDGSEGLKDLHHALELNSRVQGARTYAGIFDLKLNKLGSAEEEFKAELANDPSYQLAIAEMGEVRYHQQRWQEAADYLAKSKTVTPELIYLLCDSYFHLNRASDADLNAEAAAVYGRNDPQFMRGLVNLLRSNQQSELADRLAASANP